ncbi:MAG: hypothetical protein ACYTFI_17270 [Planctomycetota bacterium]|jgi:hypothetical protein
MALALLAAAACGCVGLGTSEQEGAELPSRGLAVMAPGSRTAEALLAAGEDEWLAPPPDKVPDRDAGGEKVTFLVACGLGLPGGASMGSAPGVSLPGYSDMWLPGFALDVCAEFKPGGKARPFARFCLTQLYGKVWQDPADPYDVWRAGDASVISLSGGVKLGGGAEGKAYGKLGLGLVVLPEATREDPLTGVSTPILDGGAGVGISLGAGVKMTVAQLKGFVDLDLHIGPSPSAAPEAAGIWPGFAAGDGLNLVTITTGLRISF